MDAKVRMRYKQVFKIWNTEYTAHVNECATMWTGVIEREGEEQGCFKVYKRGNRAQVSNSLAEQFVRFHFTKMYDKTYRYR